MLRGVDFLGIGVQKAATTWLWENLRRHPGIWLPPVKEIHYFDRSEKYPSPNDLASENLNIRLFGKQKHNKQFRRKLMKGALRVLRARMRENDSNNRGAIAGPDSIVERSRQIDVDENWMTVFWYLNYYLGTYNDSWYVSLFEQGKGKVKGEITPSYSILNYEDVLHVKSLFPALKIILILRNPIERTWSNVRFNWTEHRFDRIDDIEAVMRLVDAPGPSLRSDYVRMLDTWSRCFPESQIHIGFYDDILLGPRKFMRSIYRFLEVDEEVSQSTSVLYRHMNVSQAIDMPREVELYLAQKYVVQLRHLSERIGGPTKSWLLRAEKVLSA